MTWGIVASAIGCSSSHLMNVAARRADSKTVAEKLSKVLEKPVAEVFPDKPKYHGDKKADRQSKVSGLKQMLNVA